jgi:hypothetical protein
MILQDIYWLAGLLEGEGSFVAHRRSTKRGIVISLKMTDRDVVERAQRILGACAVYEVAIRPPSKKPSFAINISGRHAAGWMMILYQFMGERRRAKIVECLQFWKSMRHYQPGKFGVKRYLTGGSFNPEYDRQWGAQYRARKKAQQMEAEA